MHASTPPSRRGESWWPAAPNGQELTPADAVWSGAQQWLDALEAALTDLAGGGRSVRLTEGTTTAPVQIATALDVAAIDAATADSRTGRHLCTSHRSVATRLGCSETTVARARKLIERAGFARTIQTGRYLTTEERARAHQVHGHRQHRMASERALVMPRHAASPRGNGDLPRRGQFPSSVTTVGGNQARAIARARAASRPTSSNKTPTRPPLALQVLAGRLARRLPKLIEGRHIGHLCRALAIAGVDPYQWDARSLHEALDQRNHTARRDSIPAHLQRDPLALLVHQLRDIITTTPQTPQQRAQTEERDRAAAAARFAADRAHAAQARAERTDPASGARIAQMIAASRQHGRHAATRYQDTTRPWRHHNPT